jgi:hypothetical protein
MSAATSLRDAMQFLISRDPDQAGNVWTTMSWPTSFRGTKPASLRELLAACQDPRLGGWRNPSRGRAENEAFSEEAQGIGTDGDRWFLSSNAGDGREGLYRLTWDLRIGARLHSPFKRKTHIGALGVHDGWVYVGIEDPDGVWKVSTDFRRSSFLRYEPQQGDDDDMFSWCDVKPYNDLNPDNVLIYTCAFADVGDKSPECLRAFCESSDPTTLKPRAMSALRVEGSSSVIIAVSENKLVRVADADIPVVAPSRPGGIPPLNRVQGGCFAPHHKWLAVCDVDNHERIQCYSTITGAFLGYRFLLADTDESPVTRNELQDICYAPLVAAGNRSGAIPSGSGRPIQVHVLELNNEAASADDFYLWHFSAPDPEAL